MSELCMMCSTLDTRDERGCVMMRMVMLLHTCCHAVELQVWTVSSATGNSNLWMQAQMHFALGSGCCETAAAALPNKNDLATVCEHGCSAVHAGYCNSLNMPRMKHDVHYASCLTKNAHTVAELWRCHGMSSGWNNVPFNMQGVAGAAQPLDPS